MTRMAGAQPTSVNIVGKPRMGKSSLLHHICQTYEAMVQRYNRKPQDFVVVYLSLQEVQCRREISFYEAVADRLLERSLSTVIF
jgi:tRNA U34 5-carboxymethylaminomethyl modifying GTPase MnmE/TrmE